MDIRRVVALAGLFFLAVCVLGMLRPIRNSFALDGLADADFYRVYFVSALVILFVPLYRRVTRGMAWSRLIPGLAFFFALNLVAFRLLYREGSAFFGLFFYGWYDLFSAALVTQFFVVTQTMFDARSAKSAYPRIIAGGAVGAALGGALTGFLAQRLGTPDLLLIAAGILGLFGLGIPLLWRADGDGPIPGHHGSGRSRKGEIARLLGHPHVRRIAVMVLLTALVKQLIDYEFNVVIGQTMGSRDAVSAFQGKFYAATQWMPLLVLVVLPATLRRWGVGAVVLVLPAVLLAATAGIALFWTLWAAVAAKGAEQVLGHSSERTSREILYVPLPDEVKLGAKTYIDVAVEKGVGKGLAGLLILLLLGLAGPRGLAWFAAALAAGWLVATVAVRREYVRSLADSIRGRFASLQSPLASLADASSTPVVERALAGGSPLQTAFMLDLLDRSSADDVRRFADAIHDLLDHRSERIRERALQVLRRVPAAARVERVRERLSDTEESVRQAAAAVLITSSAVPTDVVRELLAHPDPRVRTAALACVAHEGIPGAGRIVRQRYFPEPSSGGAAAAPDGGPGGDAAAGPGRNGKAGAAVDAEAGAVVEVAAPFAEGAAAVPTSGQWRIASAQERLELAAASAALPEHPDVVRLLEGLLADPDPRVASAALQSAGILGLRELADDLVRALGSPSTRRAAADALVRMGAAGVEALAQGLEDEELSSRVRRHVPAVLGRVPEPEVVDVLLRSYAAPETDQLLDYRTLKALNKIHLRRPDLPLDRRVLLRTLGREVAAARRYASTELGLAGLSGEAGTPAGVRGSARLLARALREAREQRRESAFRVLSLMFPGGDEMYHCYLALSAHDLRVRANALEWLEQTVGPELFRRLRPVLERVPWGRPREGDPTGWLAAHRLWTDKDRWIARCAVWAAAELRGPEIAGELRTFRFRDPSVARSAGRLGRLLANRGSTDGGGGLASPMDLIQKVFLLQNVDLLREARSGQLALLASIAEEVDVDADRVLVRKGEPPAALYVVIRGQVELRGLEDQCLQVAGGSAFGTWALIDQSPSLVEARTSEPTRLLKIDRRGFEDLLGDHPELGLDLLRGLARRFRALAGR